MGWPVVGRRDEAVMSGADESDRWQPFPDPKSLGGQVVAGEGLIPPPRTEQIVFGYRTSAHSSGRERV